MHELIQILQIYTGARDSLATPLNAEQWEETLNEAKRQSLVGIFNEVIQHLPLLLSPPMKIRVQSALMAEDIATRNSVMDSHCAEISEEFHSMGLECCILKGQGLAKLYPYPENRACGDIDVWIQGRIKETLTALRSKWTVGEIFYHHTDIHPFKDKTEVEVHFRPSWMNNPFTDRKLQAYFDFQAGRRCDRKIDGLDFPIPDISFNCVFCAVHIYRHLLLEGVGLRQIMDYYYVLRHSTEEDRASAAQILKRLKMKRFIGALMYVLRELFLLKDSLLVMQPDEKYGRFLLNEIRLSGNFGRYDSRYDIRDSDPLLQRVTKKLSRLSHFISIAPSEVLWAPYFKIWQHIWRLWFHPVCENTR